MIVIGVLGFVVVIVMGMVIDSLRLRDGPGSAAGMASLAVGLGSACRPRSGCRWAAREPGGIRSRRPDQRCQHRT